MQVRRLLWALPALWLTTCATQTDGEQLEASPGYVVRGELPDGIDIEDVLTQVPPGGFGVVGDPTTGQLATIVPTSANSPEVVSSNFSVTDPAACTDCGDGCDVLTRTIEIGLTQDSGPEGSPLQVQPHASTNFNAPEHSPSSWISSVGSNVTVSTLGTLGTCATFSYYFDIVEVECVTDDHCEAPLGVCDPNTQTCVECIGQSCVCDPEEAPGGDQDPDGSRHIELLLVVDPAFVDFQPDDTVGFIQDMVALANTGFENTESFEPPLTIDLVGILLWDSSAPPELDYESSFAFLQTFGLWFEGEHAALETAFGHTIDQAILLTGEQVDPSLGGLVWQGGACGLPSRFRTGVQHWAANSPSDHLWRGALQLAHSLGHSLDMTHDQDIAGPGFVMGTAGPAINADLVFSEHSVDEYVSWYGSNVCLENNPLLECTILITE
jgi:hypothetical protein